jgi:hypothetical protein
MYLEAAVAYFNNALSGYSPEETAEKVQELRKHQNYIKMVYRES